MLQFLTPSKTRRRLLTLLWGEEARGSVSELAERAGVSFASAHSELKAMRQARLAEAERTRRKEVYFANRRHPDADLLRKLVATEGSGPVPSSAEDEALKGRLKALGAPLRGARVVEGATSGDVHETLVDGVRLARRDAVAAKALPLCFWKQREALDGNALDDLVALPEDKHALGFFLELTSTLGDDRRLLGMAERFRDRRVTSVHDFFFSTRKARSREFPLAEKWGFRMNMELDTFRSLFDKFVER